MARRLFLVPMEGAGTRTDPRRGKYTHDAALANWSTLRYGDDDSAIIFLDGTNTYLNFVASQPDATEIARVSNIDNTLNASQADAVKAVYEAADIPGEFINAGETRREAIRKLVGMFLFSQRMEGLLGESWRKKYKAAGMTLNSTWADFPQPLKDALIAVRDDFGWTNAELGVTNASTMREILLAIAAQFATTPIHFGKYQL